MTEEQIAEVVKRIVDRWDASMDWENYNGSVVDDIAIKQGIERNVRNHIEIAQTIVEVLTAPPPGLPGALRCQRCLKPLGGLSPELHDCAA